MKLDELRGMFSGAIPVKLSGAGEVVRGGGSQPIQELSPAIVAEVSEWVYEESYVSFRSYGANVHEDLAQEAIGRAGWPKGTTASARSHAVDGSSIWVVKNPYEGLHAFEALVVCEVDTERRVHRYHILFYPEDAFREDEPGLFRIPDGAWVHSQADEPGSIWIGVRDRDLGRSEAHKLRDANATVRFRHEKRTAYAVASHRLSSTDETYLIALGPPHDEPFELSGACWYFAPGTMAEGVKVGVKESALSKSEAQRLVDRRAPVLFAGKRRVAIGLEDLAGPQYLLDLTPVLTPHETR